MANCRKPHDLAWSPQVPPDRYFYFDAATVTEGQAADGPNLLENGDFEDWTDAPAPRPVGWLASGQQPVAAIVETDVKTGRRAARLTTRLLQGHVFFDQSVPAERFAGKTVTLSVWIKTQMKAGAGLQILDFV